MILMIGNYDSFTWNLVQYLQELGQEVEVVRNDALDAEGIAARGPQGIVISPGPGRPDDAGVSLETIRRFSGRLPILGVCLGHQAIVEAFGGEIGAARVLVHGKATTVRTDGRGLFHDLPDEFEAGRYHSLVVDPGSLPAALVVTATTDLEVIMGLRHRSHPTEGVQFHPESILTTVGKDLMRNFLRAAGLG